jgi:hypothetical protein
MGKSVCGRFTKLEIIDLTLIGPCGTGTRAECTIISSLKGSNLKFLLSPGLRISELSIPDDAPLLLLLREPDLFLENRYDSYESRTLGPTLELFEALHVSY